MIQAIGWIATALVLAGYWFNANNKKSYAFITWIVGDVGWITYDVFITNWSHLALSVIIITFNVYGIFNNIKQTSQ